MNIKIKLEEGAIMPSYARVGDAGLDLTAVSMNTVKEDGFAFIEYDTKVFIEIPDGFVGYLFPRSSVSNTGLILANSVGVIDSSYRGSIKFRFKYVSGSTYYKVGERIGQLVIMPIPKIELEVVESLSLSERGVEAFGSTNSVTN